MKIEPDVKYGMFIGNLIYTFTEDAIQKNIETKVLNRENRDDFDILSYAWPIIELRMEEIRCPYLNKHIESILSDCEPKELSLFLYHDPKVIAVGDSTNGDTINVSYEDTKYPGNYLKCILNYDDITYLNQLFAPVSVNGGLATMNYREAVIDHYRFILNELVYHL